MADPLHDPMQLTQKTRPDPLHDPTAVVKVDEAGRRLHTYVSGGQKRDYFSAIRKQLRTIQESFEKLGLRELVPLPDNGDVMVEYDELVGLERMGKEYITIGKLGRDYSISALLDGIERKQDRGKEQQEEKRVVQARTIFVSSTSRDLAAHRAAVKEQIARRDLLFRGMEHFGASPDNLTPLEKIREGVCNADVYLGIFGVSYGFVHRDTGLSMTEIEFREAEASKKPMLLYLIHEDAPVRVADIEGDPQSKTKLNSLARRIKENYVVYKFLTVEDLARQVYEDLGKL